jgi:hypothetical protein
VDWIELAQDTDKWRALLKAVVKLHVPHNARNVLTSSKIISFGE